MITIITDNWFAVNIFVLMITTIGDWFAVILVPITIIICKLFAVVLVLITTVIADSIAINWLGSDLPLWKHFDEITVCHTQPLVSHTLQQWRGISRYYLCTPGYIYILSAHLGLWWTPGLSFRPHSESWWIRLQVTGAPRSEHTNMATNTLNLSHAA